MVTLGDNIRSHVESLIPVFGIASSNDRILEVFDLLTRESLALDLERPLPKFSTINNDGVPFEFSISSGGPGGGLRFLTEVGIPGSSLPNRMAMSVRRLKQLSSLLQLEDATDEVDTALEVLFPQNPRELMGWRGGMWFAAAFLPSGQAGLRIYCNTADGELSGRWNRAEALLTTLGRRDASRRLQDMAPLLSDAAEPLGVAFDILPHGLGKIKFYLRTTRCTEAFLDEVLDAAELSHYRDGLHLFSESFLIVRKVYPPTSVVLSVEFLPGAKSAPDVKIDVCAHCLFLDDQTAHQACHGFGEQWPFPLQEYQHMLDELASGELSANELRHHSFHGMGFSHGKSPRFNIYLKPSVEAYLSEEEPNILSRRGFRPTGITAVKPVSIKNVLDSGWTESVHASIEYILSRQAPAGQWLDFELPVGTSEAWVTAYVGLALVKLPPEFRSRRVNEALRRAGKWCLAAMQPDFGWGYNAFTESDADSSAYSVLFLTAMKQGLPQGCFNFLLSHQQEDGGFATYKKTDPADTWGISHADVTPVVLRALMHNRSADGEPIERGRSFVLERQNEDGYWESYWWKMSLYSTWANLSLLAAVRWPFRDRQCIDYLKAHPIPDDPFHLALLAGSRRLLESILGNPHQELLPLLDRLRAMQERDGRWASCAMLRLTNSRLKTPWTHEDAGPLFTDQKSLFTTATVLVCMHSILKEKFTAG